MKSKVSQIRAIRFIAIRSAQTFFNHRLHLLVLWLRINCLGFK